MIQTDVNRGHAFMYLVSADCQLPLPGLCVSLQKHVAHLENLLHDSVLPEVVLPLIRNETAGGLMSKHYTEQKKTTKSYDNRNDYI